MLKKYFRLFLIIALSTCCLLTAKAVMWTAKGLNLGKINLQGSLSQRYNLGPVGALDGEVFPIQLVHTLSPYPLGSLETLTTLPVVDDLFEVAFKSNLRNAKIVAESIRKKRMDSV